MRRVTTTVALWLAGATAIAATLVLFGVLGWRLFLGGSEPLPEIVPLKIAALDIPAAPQNLTKRNPFDPSGTHWQDARVDSPPIAEHGALSGLVVLPGVHMALTEGGIVKPGGALGGGKFRGFRGDVVNVEIAPGRFEKIEGPGANRPHLQDINQADKARHRASVEGRS